jgi:AcrR family transcriptional regulator
LEQNENGRAAPRSDRGRKTRGGLLRAARRVFERKGYLETRVVDITTSARVAVGTFYQYFDSKDEIFRAVVAELGGEIWESGTVSGEDGNPLASIESANRRFLKLYRDNARLMAVVEQAATIDQEFREIRRQLRTRSVSRLTASIRKLQKEGLADARLDPRCTASALISMVNNFAYTWLVIGEKFDEPIAIETLNRLWAQAIGLQAPGFSAAKYTKAKSARS